MVAMNLEKTEGAALPPAGAGDDASSRSPASRAVLLALSLMVAVGYCAWAILKWRSSAVLFDDAFISFRYAKNIAAGHGFVFNPGERVEGATNFLWVLIAALSERVVGSSVEVMRTIGF